MRSSELRDDLIRRLLLYCERNEMSYQDVIRLFTGEIALADLLMLVEGCEATEMIATEGGGADAISQ